MKSPQLLSNLNTFFFDLSLADVYGAGCAALSLIYYGSRRGVFCSTDKQAVDLDKVDAIQISLAHRTTEPLSSLYDYHLVYFRKHKEFSFWNARHRKRFPKLKKLIRRVVCGDEQGLNPQRLKRWYIKSRRPVHVAQYGDLVAIDDYVPEFYTEKLSRCFEGYLMRTHEGYPLDYYMFDKLGLNLVESRSSCVASSVAPSIGIYVKD